MVAVTPPPIVSIEWVDSSAHGEPWDNLADTKRRVANYPAALRCYSVGYLVIDEDKTVTIAHSYTLTESGAELAEICGGLTIPRAAVTKLRKLKIT